MIGSAHHLTKVIVPTHLHPHPAEVTFGIKGFARLVPISSVPLTVREQTSKVVALYSFMQTLLARMIRRKVDEIANRRWFESSLVKVHANGTNQWFRWSPTR
jgi:hypothetical protein